MRFLSPATRQKLAILLKSKEKLGGSPNLEPPPIVNSSLKPPVAAKMPEPQALNASKMGLPTKFSSLKSKLKFKV